MADRTPKLRPTSDDAHDPPIEDYAVIGDCRTVGLISRQGSIDWLCLPDISSPSVFAALLDRSNGGRFCIRPAGAFAVERRYLPDTNVLETVFVTGGGRVRLLDFMPIKKGQGFEPEHEIVRIIEGVEGSVEVELIYKPRPDYARAIPRLERRGALGWVFQWRGQAFLLASEAELAGGGVELHARFRLGPGERKRFSFVHTTHDALVFPMLGEAADDRLASTVAWWETWSRRCSYKHRHRSSVLRSLLLLKLLTFSQSGAVLAAATTSLPEAIGADRNYDYRYCWLRDASTTLRDFFELGYREEGEAFLAWLLHSTRLTRPKLQVVYDVYGRAELREKELGHLSGYRRSRPVRIGNKAGSQIQLDVYGSVVFGAHYYADRGGTLDRAQRKALLQFGDVVCRSWRDPDSGIWEIPGNRRQYVHSKLMCWVTLNCLIKMHESGQMRVPLGRYRGERSAIAAEIEKRGFDATTQSYVAVFDESDLDASVLQMAQVGYVDAADRRLARTYLRLQRELGRNGLLFRYRPGFDGMSSREGAFGICTFWAIEYLALAGRLDEANALFDRMLATCNDVGLMAEEVDPDTGEALGNFPQTYTHAGLISAALALRESERELRKRC